MFADGGKCLKSIKYSTFWHKINGNLSEICLKQYAETDFLLFRHQKSLKYNGHYAYWEAKSSVIGISDEAIAGFCRRQPRFSSMCPCDYSVQLSKSQLMLSPSVRIQASADSMTISSLTSYTQPAVSVSATPLMLVT